MANLEIHFIDVEQGDCTLVIFPDDTCMLVDMGSKKDRKDVGQTAIDQVTNRLNQRNISNKLEIEYLIITHGDGDHYNMLPDLYKTGVKFNSIHIGGEKEDYGNLWNDLGKPSVTTYGDNIYKNCFIQGVNFQVDILSANYPTRGASEKNPKSIVLHVKYLLLGDEYYGAILMGDAEESVEQSIIANQKNCDIQSNFLKLGHHVSKNGTSSDWIKYVELNRFAECLP